MNEWQQRHAFLISVFFRTVTDPRPRLQRALKSLPIERTENKSALTRWPNHICTKFTDDKI